MRLAVKIGGSIAIGPKGPRTSYVSRLRDVVPRLELEKLVIGIGGGRMARAYLSTITPLLSPEDAETVVVELLRANTRFMAILLGGRPILDEAALASADGRVPEDILVVGGIRPGRSTDANTALLAEAIGADLFVKMTDVGGVYDADPKTHGGAKLLKEISYQEALSLSVDGRPGSYGVLDRLSIQVLARSAIPVRVIDGRNPKALLGIIKGADLGTLISSNPSPRSQNP